MNPEFNLKLATSSEQAPGVQMISEDIFYLYAGGETYIVDISPGAPVQQGLIHLTHHLTGIEVINRASIGLNGIPNETPSFSVALPGDEEVLRVYYYYSITSPDQEEPVGRRRTVRVEYVPTEYGVRVRILTEDQSTEAVATINGINTGAKPSNSTTLQFSGTLAYPTFAVEHEDQTYFVVKFLDITQSHGTKFVHQNPKLDANTFQGTTYSVNTEGEFQKPFFEEIVARISTNLEDVMVCPALSEDAKGLVELSQGPMVMITNKGDWTKYSDWYQQLLDWDVTPGYVYAFGFWNEPNYSEGGQSAGQDWCNPGDPAGFGQFFDLAKETCGACGAYTLWGIGREGTPSYDANDRLLNADGTPRESVWGSTVWMNREDSVPKYLDNCIPDWQDYGFTGLFLDVTTYGPPNTGNGDSVDLTAGSSTGTLGDVIKARRDWMKKIQDEVGPTIGEGSRVNYLGDNYLLYAGVNTGNQQWWSTNAGKAEPEIDNYDETISGFPMVVDFEWKVGNKYMTHMPNTIDRFFSAADGPDFPGLQGPKPLVDELLDRMWTYCLLLGRQAPIFWGGEDKDFWMSERHQLKSAKFIAPIVAQMKADPKEDVSVHYFTGKGSMTFEEAYADGGLDSLRRCKVLIQKAGRQLYINRSDIPWNLENFGGVDISIPRDGYAYIGVHGGKNITAGSVMIPEMAGNARVDVCLIAGEQVAIDTRGAVDSLLGIDLSEFPLRVLTNDREINVNTEGVVSVADKGGVFPS